MNKETSELISYDRIYDGKISEQIRIYHKFEEIFERREQLLTENQEDIQSISICETKKRKKPPCDPLVDPLHCIKFSNGQIYIYI